MPRRSGYRPVEHAVDRITQVLTWGGGMEAS